MKKLKSSALLLVTIFLANTQVYAQDCKPAYKPECVLKEYYNETERDQVLDPKKYELLINFTVDLNNADIANKILNKWGPPDLSIGLEETHGPSEYLESTVKLMFTAGRVKEGMRALLSKNTLANKESNYRALWPLYLRGDYSTMFSLAEEIAAIDGTKNRGIIANCIRRPSNYPWPIGLATVNLAKAGKTEDAMRGLKIIQNFREHSKILYNCLSYDADNAYVFASIEIAKTLVESDQPERAKELLERGVNFLSRIYGAPDLYSYKHFARLGLAAKTLFPEYELDQYLSQLNQVSDMSGFVRPRSDVDPSLELLFETNSYERVFKGSISIDGASKNNSATLMDRLIEEGKYNEFFDILSELEERQRPAGLVRLINAELIGKDVPKNEVLKAWELYNDTCNTDCNKNYLYSITWFANNRHLSAVDWYW